MEDQTVHFRHILLFYFNKGKNARQAFIKLNEVYGDNAPKERQCQRWFARFRAGDFTLNDAPRSGRPIEVDDDKIMALIKSNPHYTTREIAEELNIHFTTVHDHLKKLGFTSKLDVWVPHTLSEAQSLTRIKREESDPFLRRMITGDEKWILYHNVVRKRSWLRPDDPKPTTSKPEIHQRKVMLSVWWDVKGVVFFQLLPRNQTINSDFYCQQLDALNESIARKRPELANRKGVVFHHDNARPHTSLLTRQKLLTLGWDVLPHPPYSPDLAPSDFHLFRALQNSLREITFESDEAVNQHLLKFFTEKHKTFYERGIMNLTQRWRKVIEQNGQYIIE